MLTSSYLVKSELSFFKHTSFNQYVYKEGVTTGLHAEKKTEG